MTEVRVIKKLELFILGKCKCGCGENISIRSPSKGTLQQYKHGHNKSGKIRVKDWYIDTRGYKVLYRPEHFNCDKKGYVYEHRYVMEKHLKRSLTSDEIIHHKDHNKLNNNLSNLFITNREEHLYIHGTIELAAKINTKDRSDVKCKHCNSDTTRIRENGRPHWLGNDKDGWVCFHCYSIEKSKKIVFGYTCLICNSSKSRNNWYNYEGGKICLKCYNKVSREAKKQQVTN